MAITAPTKTATAVDPVFGSTSVVSDGSANTPQQPHNQADLIIVGAGIAGCAAAVAFGRQGRSVIVLERSLKEPERVVGELLQPGGVKALEALGLTDCLEGIDAVPCYGYRVSYHKEAVNIPYPKAVEAPYGSPEGRAFRHGRFIQKLREAVKRTPNVKVIESKVTEIVEDKAMGKVVGVTAETGPEMTKEYYFGKLTLVADGYASTFRKSYLPNKPASRSKFWALELLEAELPTPYFGHVILSNAPPILLYQISPRQTRIFMDIPTGLPSAKPSAGGIKAHMLNVVLPELPEGCQNSFKQAVAGGKFRSMPNSFLPPSTQKTPGLVMIGDALNMRHPLTGGGMTVAFNDVVLLSRLLAPEIVPSLDDSAAVLKQMARFHWTRKQGSSIINILAMALYSLFAADDAALDTLRNGCFRYFQRGGKCIDEPCGMLAGLIRAPWVLVYHFFSVAFYAMWLRVTEVPIWQKPYELVVASPWVLWTACWVIGPYLLWECRA
ncbi:squalene epoxidase [Colletotrichum truncatum]|uniref:Squalene epoxidase n=1 Tax=Colletotrichum truncatum TaxID=5467 RepID=A0ACC3YH11_COLTU|nr:squalene epoxidase [Colletotrichum truncatum]KAF6788398.1 squalene epoxidase [Colletotrichum truncatum]